MIYLGILITLLLSALFSGSEIGFVSANKLGIVLHKESNSKRGKILASFYKNPARFLSTMLVGNNIVLVIFTYLMSMILEPGLSRVTGIENSIALLLIITVIITIIVLIFGEYLPKTIFNLYAEKLLFGLSGTLNFFQYLLFLPATIVSGISNFFLKKVLKTNVDPIMGYITRHDLEHFVNETASKVTEENQMLETEMFKNALELQEIKVREFMVPRTDIVAQDVEGSLHQLKALFVKSNLSRIPIYKEDIDHIVGYVHHLSLLEKSDAIEENMIDIPIIPEAMTALDVLNQFKREGTTIAAVVDEYGGTSGLVTMEDVLEEIFGEIEDEHDDDNLILKQLGEREFLISGRAELDHLNEAFEELEIINEDVETLSGHIVMNHGDIPAKGDEIEIGKYQFLIEEAAPTRVELIRVIKVPETDV